MIEEKAEKRPTATVRLALGGAALAALLAAAGIYREEARSALERFEGWAHDAGGWGVAAFALMYVAATVAFLPGWILTVGAGLIYGLAAGTVLVSLSSTAGAALAFILARGLMRGAIESRVAARPTFASIDRAIGQSGWKIVLLLRLSPIFPFNLLNYALGLTRIPLAHYVLASWIGMLPGTLLYVYLGSLGNYFAASREKTPLETAFLVGGLAATAAVTVLIARIARRALSASVGAAAGREPAP
jgi:uncharacterized membrane protein YdjX (TVP38/TMEM64 family)